MADPRPRSRNCSGDSGYMALISVRAAYGAPPVRSCHPAAPNRMTAQMTVVEVGQDQGVPGEQTDAP